ncbi:MULTISPECIES: helix-turn-helix domain-containing protein [Mesorhizobium]|uniref:helix-turn-helix transcriptional regulator n=1 Tax=Mesorhizobium TaxID=68287 RepID=UPI000BAFC295|nr:MULTISPECIES: helix-turn-helix domain-containing protein [Mesorhizobium]PBB29617.1 DNA-binding protein [Mesorhizobium sp. WSM3882]PBB39734.1 DNA-binding protein [Mesorhizobium sp. WSM3868]PBB40822.1 DNA-binding protein [Mesorhizobium sp. WSM3866]PBB58862.1 DNA-binding protein [Mesorhizobium loti]PBB85057.1 DNA-binding protein [Mesorhizobium sp. WSM3876]
MDDENERAARAKKGSPFLNTAQAAFYIGLSQRTLEKMRLKGSGPKFRKHGRYVRYHIDELDEWSKGHPHCGAPEAGSTPADDGGRS